MEIHNEFPGKGKRKPQINLPLDLIFLDVENPRLAKQREVIDQIDILRTLYDEYDLEELALSMTSNGYFDEEPIIVVPRNFPEGYEIDESKDTDTIQSELKELISKGRIDFTVVEGNRRISTAKILTSVDLRSRLNIKSTTFSDPKNPAVTDDLKVIPAIVYADRKNVSPYLGVRHISGLLKWDAYAKAAYIAQNIEQDVTEDFTFADSIFKLQSHLPDRSDVIRKQYLCYRVVKEAEEHLGFDTTNIKDRFSLITVALNSPAIRDFIGVDSHKNVDFDERVVSEASEENLRHLLTWIYGNNAERPVLTDSRLITAKLAPVLASKTATEYLLENGNLNDAYERSEGEKSYLLKKLANAERDLTFVSKPAYIDRYKGDEEFREAARKCYNVAKELIDWCEND